MQQWVHDHLKTASDKNDVKTILSFFFWFWCSFRYTVLTYIIQNTNEMFQ